jgi:hypothetical protein
MRPILVTSNDSRTESSTTRLRINASLTTLPRNPALHSVGLVQHNVSGLDVVGQGPDEIKVVGNANVAHPATFLSRTST